MVFATALPNRMRYEIKNQIVMFYLDNPKRVAKTIATKSFAGTGLSEQQVTPIVESLVKKFRGHSLGSQQSITTNFLRPFFAYYRSKKSSWPTSSADWQLTIFRFFQFYLADSGWSKAGSGLRMGQWRSQIGGILEFLVEDEIIPRDVVIPRIDIKRNTCLLAPVE